jgi:low temperature requirement protein LtrA
VIAVDFGTALIGDPGWRIVPAHFAERHNLIIIIALGESIVALGAGADVELTPAVVATAALGATLAAALWRMYFDVVALVTERRLEHAPEGRTRMVVARDSYAYLHFPMITGIVLGAFGLEQALHHVDQPLDWVHAATLFGGTALYLVAHVTLRLRNARTLNRERLAAAVVLAMLVPAAVHVVPLVSIGAINAVVWAVVAFEAFYVYDERRYRLRHGLEIDVP